jgi:hypothetical protein
MKALRINGQHQVKVMFATSCRALHIIISDRRLSGISGGVSDLCESHFTAISKNRQVNFLFTSNISALRATACNPQQQEQSPPDLRLPWSWLADQQGML